jgi:hypothetical protein
MTTRCPTKTINGIRRKLGLLHPTAESDRAGLTLPWLGDSLGLDPATLKQRAQSGDLDKRRTFNQTWIRNQGSHGSCNGFAGALALSRARRRVGMSRVILSGAYLYSRINGGRDQGSHLSAGMRTLAETGCATEATVKWDEIYPSKYNQRTANAEAEGHRAFECYRLIELDDVWTALSLGFDCVVAVHVGRSFSSLDRHGFAGVDRGSGNHAVSCDGLIWANGELAATAYNSWGTGWGDRGRMLLRADHFEQTIAVHDFYAIRSATDADPPLLK